MGGVTGDVHMRRSNQRQVEHLCQRYAGGTKEGGVDNVNEMGLKCAQLTHDFAARQIDPKFGIEPEPRPAGAHQAMPCIRFGHIGRTEKQHIVPFVAQVLQRKTEHRDHAIDLGQEGLRKYGNPHRCISLS